jgi:hypothetical protein
VGSIAGSRWTASTTPGRTVGRNSPVQWCTIIAHAMDGAPIEAALEASRLLESASHDVARA